ncbi:hypothetical protein E2C01_096106 [Portunus trituberculatus]|uniref:Uncharacterized protein n=1 Tax=Portunus trituberculatus TaxID=210409 RepID=A0A5B7JX52_PORTR|nr:hypothetical protein [Portunus trituberculatus]
MQSGDVSVRLGTRQALHVGLWAACHRVLCRGALEGRPRRLCRIPERKTVHYRPHDIWVRLGERTVVFFDVLVYSVVGCCRFIFRSVLLSHQDYFQRPQR